MTTLPATQAGQDRAVTLTLTLYVAGDNGFSRRAKANLDLVLIECAVDATIRLVDVLEHPEEAMARRIFATPALVVASGSKPASLIVGDLSDRERVISILRGTAA